MARSGPLLPARYIFAFLISVGLAIIYGLKVVLSVAIVAMVNNTGLAEMASHGEHNQEHSPAVASCVYTETGNATKAQQDGTFLWDEVQQGLILGSYFWGYIVTQVPGGRVAEMFSGKWVMWGAVLVNAVCTLLTPVAANYGGHIGVIVVRCIEGLGAGVSMPSIHVMLSHWALPQERNRMSSFAFSGMTIGTVVALPLSGILADKLGWESVFYVQGGLSLIWCVLWIFLVYDTPYDHPRIHPEELHLFETAMPDDDPKHFHHGHGAHGHHHHKSLPIPWKALICSGPFWAILVAHTCSNFGWYMLLVKLPTYMKHVLRFNISENAGLSCLPYLCMWIFSILWSNALDFAKSKKWISSTNVKKLSTGVASLLPAASLVGVALVGCDRAGAVALMTIGTMFIAGMYCGFLSNHIDIASHYAGTLMAITNTFATIPGFVVPIFVGYITHGNQTVAAWQTIFYITAGIFAFECLFYSVFASGEDQPWNHFHENDEDSEGSDSHEATPAKRSDRKVSEESDDGHDV